MLDNPKLAADTPLSFGFFPGFTYLFENSATSPVDNGSRLCCDFSNPSNDLYKATAGFVENTIALSGFNERYAFVPLPPDTYHVTACDLINLSNLDMTGNGELANQLRPLWSRNTFSTTTPPMALKTPAAMLERSSRAADLLRFHRDTIRFRFRELEISFEGGAALIAALEPADRSSSERFSTIREIRLLVQRELGLPGSMGRDAHISLGYFAESSLARAAEELVGNLSHKASAALCANIEFDRICLYVFRDMITFWRLQR